MPPRRPHDAAQIESYAQDLITYAWLFQDVVTPSMRDSPERVQQAFALAREESLAECALTLATPGPPSMASLRMSLSMYKARCAPYLLSIPSNMEDIECARVATWAFACSDMIRQLMSPSIYSRADFAWFAKRKVVFMNQAMAFRALGAQTAASPPVPVVRFIGDDDGVIVVSNDDLLHWKTNPRELLGKVFTLSAEHEKQTILVSTYGYNNREGDVLYAVYEARGKEERFLLEEMITLLEGSDEVMNPINTNKYL